MRDNETKSEYNININSSCFILKPGGTMYNEPDRSTPCKNEMIEYIRFTALMIVTVH